ncbi:MAG: exodeoxyribonuclease VII small subunit [Peptococcaceae bacterium]|nr:exodeoxyribonuclease VII small subunit [Peptococcaceae bacterium]
MAKKTQPPAKSFEQGIETLEEIIKSLEEQEVPLEKALDLFSEGAALVQYCSAQLDQAEKKMEILLEDAAGNLRIETATLQTEG